MESSFFLIECILLDDEGFGSKGNSNLESMWETIQSEGILAFRGVQELSSKIYIKRSV